MAHWAHVVSQGMDQRSPVHLSTDLLILKSSNLPALATVLDDPILPRRGVRAVRHQVVLLVAAASEESQLCFYQDIT